MYIGSLSYAGAASRSGGTGDVSAGRVGGDSDPVHDSPSYFRTISSISHGSLAAAYQAMREQDMGMAPAGRSSTGKPNLEPSVAHGAISSGAGIPAALSAYAEVIDYSEADAD